MLNTSCPINASHDDNMGLVARLTPISPLSNALYYYDLNGLFGGILSNVAWKPLSSSLSYLDFSGNSLAAVTLPTAPAKISGNNPRTIAISFKIPSGTAVNNEMLSWGGNGLSGERFGVGWYDGSAIWAECINCGVNIPFTNDSNWHRLVVVVPNGATTISQIQMYLDGKPKTTSVQNGSTSLNTQQTNILLGQVSGTSTGAIPYPGFLGDIIIMSRAVGADWVERDYEYTLDVSSDPRLVFYDGVMAIPAVSINKFMFSRWSNLDINSYLWGDAPIRIPKRQTLYDADSGSAINRLYSLHSHRILVE